MVTNHKEWRTAVQEARVLLADSDRLSDDEARDIRHKLAEIKKALGNISRGVSSSRDGPNASTAEDSGLVNQSELRNVVRDVMLELLNDKNGTGVDLRSLKVPRQSIATIRDGIAHRLSRIDDRSASLQSQLTEKLDTIAATFSTRLEGLAQQFDSALVDRIERLESALAEKTATERLQFEERLAALEKRIDASSEESREHLETLHSEIASALDQRVAGVRESVEAMTQELLPRLKTEWQEKIDNLRAHVEDRLSRLVQPLDKATQKPAQDLNERHAQLASTVDGKLEELDTSVRSITEELIPELDTNWKTKFASEIAQLKEQIMQSLGKKLTALSSAIADLPQRIEAKDSLRVVEERLGNIETNLQSGSQTLDKLTDAVADLTETRASIENLDERLESLPDVASRIENTRDDLGADLDAVRAFLKDGFDRRRMHRTLTQQRILGLRDALRDQLALVDGKSENGASSLLAAFTGKAKNSVPMTEEEMATFRNLIEDILEGLEFVIYEINKGEPLA